MTNTAVTTTPKVASSATQTRTLPRRELNLIGLFGTDDDLSALVRLPNGRVKTVRTGNRVAQSKVLGIDPDGIVLEKSGQTKRLEIPGG